MPSLWKSGSNAGSSPGRGKAGTKSIRGTISGPIPIPSALDDDEFPIRNRGSGRLVAATHHDDEFPIRRPGTGIASPAPPIDEQEEEKAGERQSPQQHQKKKSHSDLSEQGEPGLGQESEYPQEQRSENSHTVSGAAPPSVSGGGSLGSHMDVIRENQVESTPPNSQPYPPAPGSSAGGSGRPATRTPEQTATSTPEKGSPFRSPPGRARTSPVLGRLTNPPTSTLRYSTVSESPSGPDLGKDGAPQRKKSTLRSALGRLFGRGKKKRISGIQENGAASSGGRVSSSPMTPSQHRSDPPGLNRSKNGSPKRSTSLPISELDRPLRSHSIGPNDIKAIESARNSLQLQADAANSLSGSGGRRRAATTSSRLFLQASVRNAEWGAGLSPRPASSHGRSNSRLAGTATGGETDDPSEIGRAITSDSGHGMRRRSRSLSGLHDMAGAGAAGTKLNNGRRRRSDEIRYWRESYDPGFMSPLSSNGLDDADADGDADDTAIMDVSAPESPVGEKPPPQTPPQPFNFGSITNQMIGMKITQAASMDTRMGDMESRLRKLESVVNRLRPGRGVPGFRQAGPRADIKTGNEAPSIADTDAQSQTSFGDAPTFVDSQHVPSSAGATQPPPLAAPSDTTTTLATPPSDRPISNSTIRGSASMPAIGRDAAGNESHAAGLAAQLEAERTARQALEAQVAKLSDRLNALSATMYAMVRDRSASSSSPRPSQERLSPSASASSVGGHGNLSSPLVLQQPPRSASFSHQQHHRIANPLSASFGPPRHQVLLPPMDMANTTPRSVFDDETDDDDEGDSDDIIIDDEKRAVLLGLGSDNNKPQDVTVTAFNNHNNHSNPEDNEDDDDDFMTEDYQTPREERQGPPQTPSVQVVAFGAFGEELRPDDDDDDDDSGVDDDDGGTNKADETTTTNKRKKAARTLSLSQLTLKKGQKQMQQPMPPTPTTQAQAQAQGQHEEQEQERQMPTMPVPATRQI